MNYEFMTSDCIPSLYLFSEQLVPPGGCIAEAWFCRCTGMVSCIERQDWTKRTKIKHWNCIATKIISFLLNWAMSEQHGCWITHTLGLMWLIVGTSLEAYRSWNTLSLITYVTASIRGVLFLNREIIIFSLFFFCGWGGQVPSQRIDLST